MKIKILMVVGVVVPSFAICATVATAERHSNMVIAQVQQQNAGDKDKDKDKDKRHPPTGKNHKQGQPTGQQQQQKPAQHQQQPAQHQQMQKPAQHQQQPAQHEMKKPAEKQEMKRPAQHEMKKPAEQKHMQRPAQHEMKKLPATPQQSGGTPPQNPVQMQKPAQHDMKKLPSTPQQSGGEKPQNPVHVQKPAMEKPAFDKNKGQTPTIQTQQHPAVPPGHRKLDQLRSQRRETHEGNRTVIHEQNRTITRENGHTIIRHDDTDRFRHGARDVHVEHRGNETITVIIRPGGVRIITIVDANGRLLRRIRREPDGREFVLIDNRHRGPPGSFGYIAGITTPVVHIPRDRYIVDADRADRVLLYETLIAPPVRHIDRRYSLDEIRYTHNLREWMPRIDLDTITFETGSWEVTPDQARLLEPIAEAMQRAIRRNRDEVYMIEGHSDAVGSDVDNLSLSDRRAESVAEILTQDYGIPPENLTTQGYGEQYLKVPTQGPELRNRRVTVRRITPLLTGQN
jgi:OmpA-OmpF porin, OOP family